MEYLFGLKLWDNPRLGVFSVETGEYDLKIGWVQKEEKRLIIGEDNETFVYRTIESDYHYIDFEHPLIKGNFIHGIGIHKTRFVKWIETQLQLF